MELVSMEDLAIGTKPFSDRDWTFVDVGGYSKTCIFLRGANNDKNTDSNLVQTSVYARYPCTIYLDFWGGSTHLDSVSDWIGDWKESSSATPTRFIASGVVNGPGVVMERNFDTDYNYVIELMGNNGYNKGTYYAFVCPQGKSHTYSMYRNINESTQANNDVWTTFPNLIIGCYDDGDCTGNLLCQSGLCVGKYNDAKTATHPQVSPK